MGEEIRGVLTFVDAPFDSVWAWVSDPSRFSTIYPSWVKRIKKVRRAAGQAYEGVSWDDDRFEIVPRLDRERGQADFEIAYKDGNAEVFRAVLSHIPKGGKHAVTALAYWWEGLDDAFKEGLKLGITKADLHRAREAIEREAAQETTYYYPYGPPYDEAFAYLTDSRVGREDGEIHIPTFARTMLERLREVGLVHTNEEPHPNVRKVSLVKGDKQQDLWIRFDTRRTFAGYMDVEVMEAPRSEAAILAAMIAWEAQTVDFERVLEVLAAKRAREEMGNPGVSFRALDEKTQAYLQDLRNIVAGDEDAASAEWDSVICSYLEYKGGDGVFDTVPTHLSYILHLIRYYRPRFDNYSPGEKLNLLKRTHNLIKDTLESFQKLRSLLEYGTPNRNLRPVIENAWRDVKVAILHDVDGLSYREIGDQVRVPVNTESKTFTIKGDHASVRKMGDRGRSILEDAFGKDGWRERAEAMRAQKAWWRSLSEEARDREDHIEIRASQLGITIEEARRRYERRHF